MKKEVLKNACRCSLEIFNMFSKEHYDPNCLNKLDELIDVFEKEGIENVEPSRVYQILFPEETDITQEKLFQSLLVHSRIIDWSNFLIAYNDLTVGENNVDESNNLD